MLPFPSQGQQSLPEICTTSLAQGTLPVLQKKEPFLQQGFKSGANFSSINTKRRSRLKTPTLDPKFQSQTPNSSTKSQRQTLNSSTKPQIPALSGAELNPKCADLSCSYNIPSQLHIHVLEMNPSSISIPGTSLAPILGTADRNARNSGYEDTAVLP